MRDFLSDRAKRIQPSGIRKFFDIVSEMEDVISLGVGEPDFITPWAIRDEGINVLRKGYTQYTSNKGIIPLRQEISSYLKKSYNVEFDYNDIMITVGASEGIDCALRAIVNEGDEILIPDPSYVSYKPMVELLGGKAVSVMCDGEDGFKIKAEQLEKVITKKTKALIFSYPNNPTGAIMDRKDIEQIIPIILKHDLLVIADEIYSELTYSKEGHVSIASFSELKDRVIYISGFSKAFAMTGWRIGFACAPKVILDTMLKIHQYSVICAPIFSQYGALAGLKQCKQDDFQMIKEMQEEYDKRRKFMYKTFCEMGLECYEPKGSFYIFPCVKSLGLTGEEFATKLLESKKVAVVPGSAFGEFGKYYIRCSYAYSMKNLIEATERINEFVKSIK